MESEKLKKVLSHFMTEGAVETILPLGNGLINDTYKITTKGNSPDYVLQRINNAVFTDVDMLQHNIEAVTSHIRQKLEKQGEEDIDRKVLRLIPTDDGKTYFKDTDGKYWRISVFIPRAKTYETVNPEYSYDAGKAFGHFESMLVDLSEELGETIPDFHNMELRMQQLRDAVQTNPKGRLAEVQSMVDELESHAEEMCKAERLHREGKLKKRICHCDTKVNNMLFDEDGKVLCVIDLDTVMPSFVFSDYGDFLRTGANTVPEDSPEFEKIDFRMDIFEAFTRGYLDSAQSFLDPIEIENLPYAAKLFPFMQCVRFLTDYINGDTYYKITYEKHNLVRAQNQLCLFRSVCKHEPEMTIFIKSCLKNK
jgi:Ser/Thr protein kinase RdoA (MazF antagonist)